jgi:heme/copper-type cytochrome/quinol oxidase subunit 2
MKKQNNQQQFQQIDLQQQLGIKSQKQEQKQQKLQIQAPKSNIKTTVLWIGMTCLFLLVLLIINLSIISKIMSAYQKAKEATNLTSAQYKLIRSDYIYGIFTLILYIVCICLCGYYYVYPSGNLNLLQWVVGITIAFNFIGTFILTAVNWSKISYKQIHSVCKTLVGNGASNYALFYNGFLFMVIAIIVALILMILGIIFLINFNPGPRGPPPFFGGPPPPPGFNF